MSTEHAKAQNCRGAGWRRHGGRRAPIVVQSMTNTDTADVEATARQVAALAAAGSELVRITVDRDEAAAAVPRIKERLAQDGASTVPLVGDFPLHRPQAARRSRGLRARRSTSTASIPAMSASRTRRDKQFSAIIEMALKHDKPVRIGANWGSLDQELVDAADGRRTPRRRHRRMRAR